MLPLSELIGKYLVTIFGEDYQINYLGNKINEKKLRVNIMIKILI